MSHFTVLVFTEKGVESEVEELLEPFAEDIEVEPYIEKCYCVGHKAKLEARKQAEDDLGGMDKIREDFNKKNIDTVKEIEKHGGGNSIIGYKDQRAKQLGSKIDAKWKKLMDKLRARETEILENHPEKDLADKTCGFYTKEYNENNPSLIGKRFEDNSGCGGTGEVETTYNPDSKWDWYEVGGRWENDLPNQSNTCKVSELKDYEPFAILDPEGEWHERGDMGWFASVSNEKDTYSWKKEVQMLKDKYPNHIAVLVDCHI